MQLSSRDRPGVREELHAGDASLQPCQRRGALLALLVERFDDDPHPLVLAEVQFTGWLEDAVPVMASVICVMVNQSFLDQNSAERVDPAPTPANAERTGRESAGPQRAVPVFVPVSAVLSVI